MTAYVLEHGSVVFSAMAGVLAARGKSVDLFGVIVLGLVNAVGGGTLRDVMLDVPVFWVSDANFVVSSTAAAVAMFFLARVVHPDPRWLLLPDALGLALVTMLGTAKAAQLGHATSVCVVMGVTTGVAGGVLRDVLCGEIPLVFRKHIYLYATAAALGAGGYLASRGPAWERGRPSPSGRAWCWCCGGSPFVAASRCRSSDSRRNPIPPPPTDAADARVPLRKTFPSLSLSLAEPITPKPSRIPYRAVSMNPVRRTRLKEHRFEKHSFEEHPSWTPAPSSKSCSAETACSAR